jgi:hypothetical protein
LLDWCFIEIEKRCQVNLNAIAKNLI